MFKVINERSGDRRYSGATEKNHISTFINGLKEPEKYYPFNKASKVIARDISTAIIVFELYEFKDQQFWCNIVEFAIIKYALEQATSHIRLVYVVGSIRPYPVDNAPTIASTNLDGYEIKIDFN